MSIALDRHIESDAAIRGGMPRLANTRITVSDVAQMHLRLGLSLEQIAARFDLSLAAVHAAMAYYYDHRGEIDQQSAEDDAFIEIMRQQTPSKLQAKLKSMNGG